MVVLRKQVLAVALGVFVAAAYLLYPGEPGAVVEERIVPAATRGGDMPVFYVKTREKRVALTFDISWGTKTAPEVLKVLADHGVKATFFLSGPWAEKHPDLVRAIVEGGHEIASHGQEHVNLSQLDAEGIRRNISRAHRILKDLTQREPRFLRPPNGDYDDLSVATARSLGYETIIWSVDSLDWKNPGAAYMVQRVTRLAFPGAILLFHASDSSRQTHVALPDILKNLEEQGYAIGTVGDLLAVGQPARDDPRGRPDYPPNRPEYKE